MAFAAGPARYATGGDRRPLVGCHEEGTTQYGYQWGGCYERRATVITSNKSLAHWGDLIGDSALMMAITDRLLHHGEVFYLRGSSFRMRGKEGITTTGAPPAAAQAPA